MGAQYLTKFCYFVSNTVAHKILPRYQTTTHVILRGRDPIALGLHPERCHLSLALDIDRASLLGHVGRRK